MEEKMQWQCDWCGKQMSYKPFAWIREDGDYAHICATCCLKGDGTVEDLTIPGD